jgi:hypothetical protein
MDKLTKIMKCERCKTILLKEEQRALHGQILCEDCYMDLLSPLKACDPWAVHSAMTFVKEEAADLKLTSVQQKIVDILRNEGSQEPANLCIRLRIKETDIERDIAALRHMQKIRGELKGGKKLIRLWSQVDS